MAIRRNQLLGVCVNLFLISSVLQYQTNTLFLLDILKFMDYTTDKCLEYSNYMNYIQMPLTKAQHNFSEAIRLVDKGKTVVFTRYGKKVCLLQPYCEQQTNPQVLSEKVKSYSIKTQKKVDSGKVIRNLRDAY